MSDDRSTITILDDGCAVILDAVQRAIVDKYAAKATRKAAFSALLALVDAGLIRDTSAGSPAADGIASGSTHSRTGLRLTG